MATRHRTMALLILLAAVMNVSASGERLVVAEVVVAAPVSAVWDAWTTEDGIATFFAPASRIEARVDGAYEIYFDPDAEPGRRGAEGTRIVVFEPRRRLGFTWNAPTSMPTVRAQRTVVYVELEPVAVERTRLVLFHVGWGDGAEWDRAYDYFDHAWRATVLPRLRQRFAVGPIDWDHELELPPVARRVIR